MSEEEEEVKKIPYRDAMRAASVDKKIEKRGQNCTGVRNEPTYKQHVVRARKVLRQNSSSTTRLANIFYLFRSVIKAISNHQQPS